MSGYQPKMKLIRFLFSLENGVMQRSAWYPTSFDCTDTMSTAFTAIGNYRSNSSTDEIKNKNSPENDIDLLQSFNEL